MCSIHCIHHDTMMHMIIIQPKNLFFGSLVQTMNLLKLYENGWCRHGVVEKRGKVSFLIRVRSSTSQCIDLNFNQHFIAPKYENKVLKILEEEQLQPKVYQPNQVTN